MATVAVTGADGFIGSRLSAVLEARAHKVIRIVRSSAGMGEYRRMVPDLVEGMGITEAVQDADIVIHLAGRAHVLKEYEVDPEAAFHRSNVLGTLRVAKAASGANARRLIFVSSIGVNGNETHGRPFSEMDAPAPVEPYAKSKLRAEQELMNFSRESGLEVVIVRPPLVYGAGAAGNFARLLRLAATGLPLPLGKVHNRRSIIGRDNLCDFLALCMDHPAARGETFLVAEPESRSTPELIAAIRTALGLPERIFSVPFRLLNSAARIVALGQEFGKLCGSLEVSAAKAKERLSWTPRVPFSEEIQHAALAYARKDKGV